MGKFIMNGVEYTSSPMNGFPPLIYSDEEREVGVWIDGKPLYEKTLLVESVNVGSNTKNHGISNIDNVIVCYGRCKYNNLNEMLPLPYVSSNTLYKIALGNVTTTTFMIDVGSGFSSVQDVYVTLLYTKTTDVAGSGRYTTYGGLAHHYSTTEQVIGTWIDGKPIYEITVPKTNIAIRSGDQIAHGVDNIKFCLRLYADMYDSANERSWNVEAGAIVNDSGQSNGFRFFPTYLLVSGNNNFSASEYRTWYFTLQYTKTTD